MVWYPSHTHIHLKDLYCKSIIKSDYLHVDTVLIFLT